MPSKVRVGFAAICDAVYRDFDTQKAVLAGVFSGDILVTRFPSTTRLAFYVELISQFTGDCEMDLRVKQGPKVAAGVKVEMAKLKEGEPVLLATPVFDFKIVEPCTLIVEVMVDGRAIRVMKKTIRLLTNADQPPS